MVDTLLKYPERTRFQILAPVVRGRKGEFEDLLELLRGDGYARALIDGEMRQLSDDIKLAKQKKHTIEVVVDRLVVKDGIRQRLTDSIETALKLSKGVAVADFVDLDEKDPDRRKPFSEKRACPNGHQLELDEIEPRTFSFNAPYGACPECTGIGYKLEIDPELVIPDPDKTLNENAIEPWGMTKGTGEYYRHVLEGLGDEMGFDLDTPWKDLPKDARDAIMYGRDFKVQVSYRNRWGRMREYSTGFEGVVRTLMRRHDETDSDQMKQYYESYMREVPCQACHGRVCVRKCLPSPWATSPSRTCATCPPNEPRMDQRPRTRRLGRADSRRSRQGDSRTTRLPQRCRPELSDVVACGEDPVGRRGAAHPTGHPDRLRPGGRHVCAGRTIHRPASA